MKVCSVIASQICGWTGRICTASCIAIVVANYHRWHMYLTMRIDEMYVLSGCIGASKEKRGSRERGSMYRYGLASRTVM
jgi:hypothetical protein